MSTAKMRWWESGRNLSFAGTVAAGIVVLVAGWTWDFIPVGKWLAAAWGFVVFPVPVPLVMLVGLVVALLFAVVGAARRAAAPPPPAFLSYTQDTFLGVVWHWQYFDHQIAKESLAAFCPECQTRLRGEEGGYREMTTVFACDECGFRREIEGSGEHVVYRILRLIEREANARTVRG